MTELAANISQAQANIDRLNLNIGDLQEKVNQALVDLQDSRARAEPVSYTHLTLPTSDLV